MTKKNFIALADVLKERFGPTGQFRQDHLEVLADFCAEQNPRFNANRWLAYIKGECGPNGGKTK